MNIRNPGSSDPVFAVLERCHAESHTLRSGIGRKGPENGALARVAIILKDRFCAVHTPRLEGRCTTLHACITAQKRYSRVFPTQFGKSVRELRADRSVEPLNMSRVSKERGKSAKGGQ